MDSQCLSKVQAKFQIELHPSKLHNVEDGVNEHLNTILFRYHDDLEGFVMAYHGVKISRRNATIHPYFPLVHLDVSARALVFKPTVGCMLVGRVIKIAADFIGLLVLGVFNASIAAESIRPDLKCTNFSSWVSKKHPEHEIKLGVDVRFQVVKLQEQAAFFGIFGSLAEKNTGALEFLKKEKRLGKAGTSKAGLDGKGDKDKKKRKRAAGEEGDGDGQQQLVPEEGGKKKKKKEQHGEGEAIKQNGTSAPEDKAAKKEGKKRRSLESTANGT